MKPNEIAIRDLQKFILEKTKFVIAERFHNSFLEDVKYEVIIDREIKGLLLRLEKDIFSEHVESSTKTFTYPKTWWDHFKLDHFPFWLSRRFPPKLSVKKITFERKVMYPKLAIAMRDDERFKEFYVWETMKEEEC